MTTASSVESLSFEAWEEVQRQLRHSQDIADKLAAGFTGLLQTHISPIKTPSFSWPTPLLDFDLGLAVGAQLGSSLNGVAQTFFRSVPGLFSSFPFLGQPALSTAPSVSLSIANTVRGREGQVGQLGNDVVGLLEDSGDVADDEVSGFNLKLAGLFGKSQGTMNITSAYDSRSRDVQTSVMARGDLWRLEASSGSSVSGSQNSLFLVQLGPLLFIRDTTLLLPVHLSKQHLLWYGYDRKNGLHSLCPAVWSKHRRWLLMSMICLNPLACSFMDLQFPNGQLTYVAGEGLSTSAYLPFCGGLIQAQGQYPGEMRFSFSCKNKWGTRVSPMFQWPDKSVALGIEQDLAWKQSGLLVRPTVQLSLCPTFGGSDPGVRAELIHSIKDQLNMIYGYSYSACPSAFASLALGRSKWNGNVGSTGIVLKVETPLSNVAQPSFSVQLNSGIEF